MLPIRSRSSYLVMLRVKADSVVTRSGCSTLSCWSAPSSSDQKCQPSLSLVISAPRSRLLMDLPDLSYCTMSLLNSTMSHMSGEYIVALLSLDPVTDKPQCQGYHLRRLLGAARARSKPLLPRRKPRQRRRTRPNRRCAHLVHHVANLFRLVHHPGPLLRYSPLRYGRINERRTIPPRRSGSAKGYARPAAR
jgi:hypothetical protein